MPARWSKKTRNIRLWNTDQLTLVKSKKTRQLIFLEWIILNRSLSLFNSKRGKWKPKPKTLKRSKKQWSKRRKMMKSNLWKWDNHHRRKELWKWTPRELWNWTPRKYTMKNHHAPSYQYPRLLLLLFKNHKESRLSPKRQFYPTILWSVMLFIRPLKIWKRATHKRTMTFLSFLQSLLSD